MTSKSEYTRGFLTLIIFYRVFARGIGKRRNVYCFIGCFGFLKTILRPCYHRCSDKYKLFSQSQFCTIVNLNEEFKRIT